MRRTITYLLSLLISTVYAQESIFDILPDTTCPGIEVSGEPILYVGDDLFDLINGGAELYHEFGFAEVLVTEILIQEADPLKVEIYDMGSPEAAWGIYSMTATSNSRQVYLGVAGRQGEGFAQFIKGNYMVYMYYDQIQDTVLQYVGGCISGHIELSSGPPVLMDIVEVGKGDAEKLFYFKGNLGLSSVYNFHYKDVFGYEQGAAAIYPDLKVFLFNYEYETSCIENYNAAKEFFINSSKYHEQLTLRGSFHMKDRKEQQIDCYFENTFLVIFIYSGEMDVNGMRRSIIDRMGVK
ncbi:MAG: hypothetical protein KAH26_11870 [Bacteroidales bacterium]|nr:hypothetical protein [Bacteroidales bacterium]